MLGKILIKGSIILIQVYFITWYSELKNMKMDLALIGNQKDDMAKECQKYIDENFNSGFSHSINWYSDRMIDINGFLELNEIYGSTDLLGNSIEWYTTDNFSWKS